MTREEAIQCIRHELLINVNRKDLTGQAVGEALDMAIDALSSDAISREAHYDAVANRITDMEERGFVSVVRCKDCKNWRESHSEDEESYCYIDGRTIDSTDYCSWGERREP